MLTGALTMGLNIGLNFLLVERFGTGGLALSYSFAGIVNLFLLLGLLRRKIGPLGFTYILLTFVETLGISFVMGAGALTVSWGLERYVVDVTTKAGQLVQVAGAVGAGVFLYIGLSLVLGLEEIAFVKNVLTRRFRKGSIHKQ